MNWNGCVSLRLESGVELSILAPAQFHIHDSQLVELTEGSMTADVPKQVIGFSIKMPGLNVVDLGTTFGVSVPEQGSPQIHVFDGVVDAQADQSDKRVRLTEGETFTFDGQSFAKTDVTPLTFVKPTDSDEEVAVSGDVRLLETPPPPPSAWAIRTDLILCFRETSEPQVLDQDVQVSITEPGAHFITWDHVSSGTVPAGSTVSSHYIQLDGIGPHIKVREGSVTFDQTVLGIVLSRKLLKDLDRTFGHHETIYPDRPHAEHDQTLENEKITLSADRKTIHLRWKILNFADQVRVIVGEKGNE